MTLSQLVTLFDQWNRTNREPGTAAFYRANLDPLCRRWGQLPATDFRPYHLLEFKGSWHRIMSVQRLFSWAQELELVPANPFAKLKRPRLGARRRVLTRGELARLLRKAVHDFRAFLVRLPDDPDFPEARATAGQARAAARAIGQGIQALPLPFRLLRQKALADFLDNGFVIAHVNPLLIVAQHSIVALAILALQDEVCLFGRLAACH